MEYKGFTIDCEVVSYETWTINEDGSVGEFVDHNNDGLDITGYYFNNEELDIHTFETMSECDGEMLRDMCDDLIKESEKK